MSRMMETNALVLQELPSTEGSLARRVYLQIKRAILSLDFPPGAIIRKAPICEHLGVSKAPVSDAITRLAAEGLVDVVPQSGTHVSYLSMEEIREGVFVRECLELAVAAKVAEELSEDQKKRLNRNMRMQELMVDDEDISGFYQIDEEFHELLMEFTGFKTLPKLAESVSVHVRRARLLLLPTVGRVTETLSEHQAIFEAICDRDPAAARENMRIHLGRLLPSLEALQQSKPEFFSKHQSTE